MGLKQVFCCCFEKGFQVCSPGYPQTHLVAEDDFELLSALLASISQVLGLQACAAKTSKADLYSFLDYCFEWAPRCLVPLYNGCRITFHPRPLVLQVLCTFSTSVSSTRLCHFLLNVAWDSHYRFNSGHFSRDSAHTTILAPHLQGQSRHTGYHGFECGLPTCPQVLGLQECTATPDVSKHRRREPGSPCMLGKHLTN